MTSPLFLELAAIRGKVTAFIVGYSTYGRARLTGNVSFQFAFGAPNFRFIGKITPLIVVSPPGDRAQLSRRNGVGPQIYLSDSISLVDRMEWACPVLVMIIVSPSMTGLVRQVISELNLGAMRSFN